MDLESQPLLSRMVDDTPSRGSHGEYSSNALVTREKAQLRVVFPRRCQRKWGILFSVLSFLALLGVVTQIWVGSAALPLGNLPSVFYIVVMCSVFLLYDVEEELLIDRSTTSLTKEWRFCGAPKQRTEFSYSTEDLIKATVGKNLCCCVPFYWKVGVVLHIARKPDENAGACSRLIGNVRKMFGDWPKKVIVAPWKLNVKDIEMLVDEINDFLPQVVPTKNQFLVGTASV